MLTELIFLLTVGRATDVLFTKKVENVYLLSHSRIVVGSEKIFYDGVLLLPYEYKIDYWKGILVLNFYPENNKNMIITYRYITDEIERYYRLLTKGEVKKKEELMENSKMNIQGLKTFFVGVNSEGVIFDQGISVRANGSIKDVDFSAYLTDEEAEYSESITEDVENLDRIYLQMNTRNIELMLGDIYDEHFWGKNIVRGGMIKFDKGQRKLSIGIGVRGWESTENRFYAEEGKQGPYFLKGKHGELPVYVIPGSEKVFLNGILLEPEKDYVIHNETGELIFLPSIPLTEDDFIVVKFSYLDEEYKKIFYVGSIADSAGEISLGVYEDDKNALWNCDTTDFVNIRDTVVLIPGSIYVGTGKGEYVKEGDIYVYKGKGKGDYSVIFTRVKNGDYIYTGEYYVFVGRGKGEYLPVVKIQLPGKKEQVKLRYGAKIGNFCIDLGGSYVKEFPNIFNSSWDVEKGGTCGKLSLDLKNLCVRTRVKYYNRYDELFQPFEGVDLLNEWGVDTVEFPLLSGETEVTYSFSDAVRLSAVYLRLNDLLGSNYRVELFRTFYGSLRFTDSLNVYSIGIKQNRNFIQAERKSFKKDTFQLIEGGLEFLKNRASLYGFLKKGRNFHTDIRIKGEYEKKSINLLSDLGFFYFTQEAEIEKGITGTVYFTYNFENGVIKVKAVHNLLKALKKRAEYIWVGEGKGDYYYDPISDGYVKKPGGGYIKIQRIETGGVKEKDDFEIMVNKNFNWGVIENSVTYSGDRNQENDLDILSAVNVFFNQAIQIGLYFNQSTETYIDYDGYLKKEEFTSFKFIPFVRIANPLFLEFSAEKNSYQGDYTMSERKFSITPWLQSFANLKISFSFTDSDFENGYVYEYRVIPEIEIFIKGVLVNAGYEFICRNIHGEIPIEYFTIYPEESSVTTFLNFEYPFTEKLYLNGSFKRKCMDEEVKMDFNLFVRAYF